MATFENTEHEDTQNNSDDDKDITMEAPTANKTEKIRIESSDDTSEESGIEPDLDNTSGESTIESPSDDSSRKTSIDMSSDHADKTIEQFGIETPIDKVTDWISSELSLDETIEDLIFELPSDKEAGKIRSESPSHDLATKLIEPIMNIQSESHSLDKISVDVKMETPTCQAKDKTENKTTTVKEIIKEISGEKVAKVTEQIQSEPYSDISVSETASDRPLCDQEPKRKLPRRLSSVKKLVQIFEQVAEENGHKTSEQSKQSQNEIIERSASISLNNDAEGKGVLEGNAKNVEVTIETKSQFDSVMKSKAVFEGTLRNDGTAQVVNSSVDIGEQNNSSHDTIMNQKMDFENRKPLFDDANEDDESLFSPIPKRNTSSDDITRMNEGAEVPKEAVESVTDEIDSGSELQMNESSEATETDESLAYETTESSQRLIYGVKETSDVDSMCNLYDTSGETSEDNECTMEETFHQDESPQNRTYNEDDKAIFVESLEVSEPLFDEETVNEINRRMSIFDNSTEVNESKLEKSNEWIKPLFDGAKQGNEALLYGAIDEEEAHLKDETDSGKMFQDGADLEAMNEFYEQLEIWGWNNDVDDIDYDAPSEHDAFFRVDHGKVYVRYDGIDVLISKERGSGFSKPSTIADHAEAKGLNGDHFVRNVLGILTFGIGRRSSISRAVKARSIMNSFSSECTKVIEKSDTTHCVELKDMNKYNEDEIAQDDSETKINFVRPQDSGLAFYRQILIGWRRRSSKSRVKKDVSEESNRKCNTDDDVFVDKN